MCLGCLAGLKQDWSIFNNSNRRHSTMNPIRLRHRLLVLAIAQVLNPLNASAQDVTVTPPAGGGFVVKDATNTATFTVNAGGTVIVSRLPAAALQGNPVCFDVASG